MDQDNKKRVLGRGLNALISNTYGGDSPLKKELNPVVVENKATKEPVAIRPGAEIQLLPIRDILPNPQQPRLVIHEDSLSELAESIKEQGVIQPIVVTRRQGKYELICGERRLRATALAGLETIPAVVKDVVSDNLLEMALVENIQREDLNPIEEAVAYSKLMEEKRLTQEEVAKKVGKDRSSVANTVRLLRLPKEVQEMVVNRSLSAGHARTLISLLSPEHQRVLAQRIVKEGLSVRQSEELAQGLLSGKKRAKKLRQLNPYIQDLERKLEMRLGTHVRIFNNKKNQGRMEIRYFSLDDLDRILESLAIERT